MSFSTATVGVGGGEGRKRNFALAFTRAAPAAGRLVSADSRFSDTEREKKGPAKRVAETQETLARALSLSLSPSILYPSKYVSETVKGNLPLLSLAVIYCYLGPISHLHVKRPRT